MEPSFADTATGTPAPYGQACANCARAKCKCILRIGGGACDRCHRLGKQCNPSTQVRKRGRAPNGGPIPRRARLEDKLDDLVSLLQAQHSGKPSTALPDIPRASSIVPFSTNSQFDSMLMDTSPISTRPAIPTPPFTAGSQTSTRTTSSPMFGSASSHSLEMVTPDAETVLREFRMKHLESFPFVYLPEGISAEEVQRRWPFLWQNIQALFNRSVEPPGALSLQIRETLARRVVVEGERSTDLLAGLLTHVSWAQYFVRGGKPYLGILSNIARTMVSNGCRDGVLGDGATQNLFPCPSTFNTQDAQGGLSLRTHESGRLLLASYVMGATVSSLIRFGPWQWSPRLDEYARLLAEQPEHFGDEVIAAIARISRITDEASQAMRQGVDGVGPTMVHVRPLAAALEQIKCALSPALLSHHAVLSYFHNATVMIHEITVYSRPSSPTPQLPNFDLRRYEHMQACLQAAKACLDNYLSMPIPEHVGVNFFIMMHSLHSLQALFRLSVLDEPGWDRTLARQFADPLLYMDRLSGLLQELHEYQLREVGMQGWSIWSAGADKLRRAYTTWQVDMDRSGSGNGTASGVGHDQQVDLAADNSLQEFADPTLATFETDMWFSDFFASWNG